jgi:hypothetical protein
MAEVSPVEMLRLEGQEVQEAEVHGQAEDQVLLYRGKEMPVVVEHQGQLLHMEQVVAAVKVRQELMAQIPPVELEELAHKLLLHLGILLLNTVLQDLMGALGGLLEVAAEVRMGLRHKGEAEPALLQMLAHFQGVETQIQMFLTTPRMMEQDTPTPVEAEGVLVMVDQRPPMLVVAVLLSWLIQHK